MPTFLPSRLPETLVTPYVDALMGFILGYAPKHDENLMTITSINEINLWDIVKDFPKIRVVAADFCCCNNGQFSLSKYSATTIYKCWESIGLKITLGGSLNSEQFLETAIKICALIEPQLVERDFEKNPLSPPFLLPDNTNL